MCVLHDPDGSRPCFVDHATTQAAQHARQASLVQEVPNQQPAHPCRLDRNHRLVINLFDDIDKYAKVSETYVAPEPKEFKPQVLQEFMKHNTVMSYPSFCWAALL